MELRVTVAAESGTTYDSVLRLAIAHVRVADAVVVHSAGGLRVRWFTWAHEFVAELRGFLLVTAKPRQQLIEQSPSVKPRG